MNIFKLSTAGLNALFSNLSEDENKVFWIRTPDFMQQIFLSASYEKIWSRPVTDLYQYPASWNHYLMGENSEKFVEILRARTAEECEINQNNNVLYRISVLDGKTKWIKDSHFYILNGSNQQVAIAGLAKEISENEWLQELQLCEDKKLKLQTSDDQAKLNQILKIEFNLTSVLSPYAALLNESTPGHISHIVTKDGIKVMLSKREIECLSFLIKGKTAKEIARSLKISHRTVELHIAHIKDKAKCRTILELVASIKGFSI